jgi:MoaA/NifB/PqqE/SkfB family radical SAM enzyme
MQDHFVKRLSSSPLREDFDYSQLTQGLTKRTPIDWQIDLGNYCNSACIFCNPESSSRLAAEFKQLQIIDELPPQSWCDDPALLARFIEDLKQNANLSYLHFLGGETVITPGFKQILVALIQA